MKTAFKQIRLEPCAEMKAQEARGLFGFHNYQDCPNCKKTEEGYHVHYGDSIFSPFAGYYPDKDTVISESPVYFH